MLTEYEISELLFYCKFCLNIAIYLRNSLGFWIRVGMAPIDELAPDGAL